MGNVASEVEADIAAMLSEKDTKASDKGLHVYHSFEISEIL